MGKSQERALRQAARDFHRKFKVFIYGAKDESGIEKTYIKVTPR